MTKVLVTIEVVLQDSPTESAKRRAKDFANGIRQYLMRKEEDLNIVLDLSLYDYIGKIAVEIADA